MQLGAFQLQLIVHVNFPCKFLWINEMPQRHFIHPLIHEVCSYLLNLSTTISQLAFNNFFEYFFIHPLTNGWMNEKYMSIAIVLQLRAMCK